MLVIEVARRHKSLSQHDLGNLTRIAAFFISQIERGISIPNADQAERLARALDLRPEQLLQTVIVDPVTAVSTQSTT